MNLNTNDDYIAAILAATSNQLGVARERFVRLVALARVEKDNETLGFVLHNLAQVEARAGNHDVAHSLYRESVTLDPESPLPLIFYAESLLHAFRLPALVEPVLREAENLLNAPAWPAVPQELPRTYYEAEFKRIRNELLREAP